MPTVTTALTERNSSEIVGGRLARAGSNDLARALVGIVNHLHLAVREIRPTPAQWREAIEFLTEVGHASDDKRQEWVLLSDLLGVTALVEEINGRRPKGATPHTVKGPFYRPDAPRLPPGANICLDGLGEPLRVSGRVCDLDGDPIAGAAVETWAANHQGIYENQQPDLQPDCNLRGIFETDAEGRFHYRTARPAGYGVPDDGPVGRMLGRIGYPLRRPAHLHFLITAAGFETITTQVYDRDDPDIDRDAILGVKPELLGDFRCADAGEGCREWALDFEFVMARARPERARP